MGVVRYVAGRLAHPSKLALDPGIYLLNRDTDASRFSVHVVAVAGSQLLWEKC